MFILFIHRGANMNLWTTVIDKTALYDLSLKSYAYSKCLRSQCIRITCPYCLLFVCVGGKEQSMDHKSLLPCNVVETFCRW